MHPSSNPPAIVFNQAPLSVSASHWHATLKAAEHLTKPKSYALFTHVACPGLCVCQREVTYEKVSDEY